MTNSGKLRQALAESEFLKLPGAYDCLGAKAIENAGFKAAYISGGALSMSVLGRPDIGFLNLTNLVNTLNLILSAVDIPIITDTDNAFGNAAHAAYTASMLERIGVAGMQIDDDILPQDIPAKDKDVLEWDMLGPKIESARKSVSDDFVIVHRIMVGKYRGMESAAKRANQAFSIGADYAFVDGMNSIDDIEYIINNTNGKMILNLNEATFAATCDFNTVKNLGYKIGLYPVAAMKVSAWAYKKVFESIMENGSSADAGIMLSPQEFGGSLGYDGIIDKYSRMYDK